MLLNSVYPMINNFELDCDSLMFWVIKAKLNWFCYYDI